jgi:acyl-CoA thioesterase YciA
MVMELITTHICKASEIGIHENMFGGDLISLVDLSSAAYAAQICDTPRVVTVKINELVFKNPVKVGNILKFYANVKEFGRTSVTIYLEVRRHNVYTATQEIVLHTEIKFVRIDEDNKAFLALFDVHLGKQKEILHHTSSCYSLSKKVLEKEGYDSVFAKGGADLRNNEYIVYNPAQCTVSHLIEIGY